MVTSRASKQWIWPKGWIEDDLTEKELAALEAEEETGVVAKPEKIKNWPLPLHKIAFANALRASGCERIFNTTQTF